MTEGAPPSGSVLWRAYEVVAMAVGLGSLAALCLTWLPLAMLAYPVLPRSVGQVLGRRAIMHGLRFYLLILRLLCGCRFDLRALDGLRDASPLIVAANHPSLLDAVLIVSRLPNAVCVMKASLMDNPLFGAAARLARYIRNRVPADVVLGSLQELQQGSQLVIFPEGTRTRDFPVGPSQAGVGLIASRAGLPVQTVLIRFSTPYLGKSWPLWRPPRLPLTCRVELGRRFDPPSDNAVFRHELDTYFRTVLDAAPCSSAD
ncbi:MAG: lysophospholipid acyltransferase family protein [Burkholderiaceae bacterium]